MKWNIRWNHAGLRRRGIAVMLLLGYALMSAVIWQQARTIDLQRDTINILYRDSLDLAALRLHKAAARKQ